MSDASRRPARDRARRAESMLVDASIVMRVLSTSFRFLPHSSQSAACDPRKAGHLPRSRRCRTTHCAAPAWHRRIRLPAQDAVDNLLRGAHAAFGLSRDRPSERVGRLRKPRRSLPPLVSGRCRRLSVPSDRVADMRIHFARAGPTRSIRRLLRLQPIHDAELRRRDREARSLVGEPEVTGQREPSSTADAIPVDHRDGQLLIVASDRSAAAASSL